MNRLIVPRVPVARRGEKDLKKSAQKEVKESGEEQVIGRLIKYIPAEIISGYMLLSGIAQAAGASSPLQAPAQWGLVVVGAVLTPFYLWRVGNPKGVQWWHLLISTVSFVLWTYALGGPFTTVKVFGYGYESWFATLVAGAFSWGIALVWTPTEKAQPAP